MHGWVRGEHDGQRIHSMMNGLQYDLFLWAKVALEVVFHFEKASGGTSTDRQGISGRRRENIELMEHPKPSPTFTWWVLDERR